MDHTSKTLRRYKIDNKIIWYWPKPHIIRSIRIAAEIPVATPFNPRRFELWDFWFDWQLSENVERSQFRTKNDGSNTQMRFEPTHLHRGHLHPNWRFLRILSWYLLQSVTVELLVWLGRTYSLMSSAIFDKKWEIIATLRFLRRRSNSTSTLISTILVQ